MLTNLHGPDPSTPSAEPAHFFCVILTQTMGSTCAITMRCTNCGICVVQTVDLTDQPCTAPPCTEQLPRTIELGDD